MDLVLDLHCTVENRNTIPISLGCLEPKNKNKSKEFLRREFVEKNQRELGSFIVKIDLGHYLYL